MRVTGLCGGIGAGKSTVASLFAEHDALIIDVDQIGRRVIEPGGRAFDDVVELFGHDILIADDAGNAVIDRAKLAPIVFGDPAELERLEAVSHPAINAELDDCLVAAAAAGHAWVVLDMAVLVESQLGQGLPSGHSYDTVVVVEASELVRIERLEQTRGMDPGDAAARIASQTDDETRRDVADIVVTNNGDLAELAKAVAAIVPTLSR
ncbi:MAG: dephospho-CoA kinase [Paracrocinitomix sp.]|jgi:dephospho-CoA kinase